MKQKWLVDSNGIADDNSNINGNKNNIKILLLLQKRMSDCCQISVGLCLWQHAESKIIRTAAATEPTNKTNKDRQTERERERETHIHKQTDKGNQK